jgi:hypothetical protein
VLLQQGEIEFLPFFQIFANSNAMSQRLPPKSVLATFPPPNYENPVTHGPTLLIISVVFLTIATVSFVLRIYVRGFVKKLLGWDDFFLCFAYVRTSGNLFG